MDTNNGEITVDKSELQVAIAIYDRSAPERDAMIERAETTADVAAWESETAKALEPVQTAFFNLTSQVNSRDKCRLVSIDNARCFAEDRPQGRYRNVPIEQRI